MFDNYKEFGEIINSKKDGKIDLSNFDFNPTTTLPLLCQCKNQNLRTGDGKNAFEFLANNLKNNIFFSELPNSRVESDESDFLRNYVGNLNHNYGSYFVLRHVISELSNNVYDHSKLKKHEGQSYILSKLDENYNKLDICVIDDGLSIPGVFELCDVDFENDSHAISKAIGTFSTVSDDLYERGNGLRTMVRLVAEGNGGEIFIASRQGSVHINGENYKYYLLDEEHKFKGTLISLRLNKYEVQNIYDLLEPHKLNSYKYDGVINDY